MFENNYASIGKSVLIHAIGMQDNHMIRHELDRKLSGCFSCPHFRQSLKNLSCSKCSCCKSKVYKDDTYVNEKNRYGYQPSLTMCAIKVFTYLHFFVTGSGVIEDFQIRDAADRLRMSGRSVHNSLRLLSMHGYICYQKNYPGSYLVLLTDYEDYFKKASQGGRGYLVLSREFLSDAVIGAESINELRLYFRMYLNLDDRKNLPIQASSYLTDSRKITSICRYFPQYMKPVHIRKLISRKSSVFEIRQQSDVVVYSLNQDYYGELQKNTYRSECDVRLEEKFSHLNSTLHSVFEHSASIATVPAYLTQHVIHAKLNSYTFYFELSETDYDDLLQLSVQYGYETMSRHLETLLRNESSISSLNGHYGTYVRHLIEDELHAA